MTHFRASITLHTTRCLATVFVAGVALLPSASSQAEEGGAARTAYDKNVVPFVNSYCVECHGNKKSKAGLNLETALTNPGSAAGIRLWKKARAHVKAHDMPPEKEVDKLPSDDERRQFYDAIGQLKFLSPKDPGLFVIRRLTKVELGNTLRDLLGVDPKVVEALPDEDAGEGYLNRFTPMQSEQFLEIANKVVLPGSLKPEVQKQLFGEMPAPEA